MHPDFEESIQTYMENEYKNEAGLLLPPDTEPKVPEYLVLKCENRLCFSTRKMTFKEFFETWTEFLGKAAFQRSQQEVRSSFNFEGYYTKYLVDRATRKIVTKKDIEGNLVFKELYKKTEENG